MHLTLQRTTGNLWSFHAFWSTRRRFFSFAYLWEDLVINSTNVKAVDSIEKAHAKFVVPRQFSHEISGWQKISIKNLWFKYEDKEHKTHQLSEVALDLRRGDKIALVGESGSGKSTLLTLLRGLDLPKKARVTVDGKVVEDMGILSTISTLIPQDPEIFDNTIEYNITAGLKHDKTDLDLASQLARFDVVMKRLPRGYKTDIKEKGVNLSGGEKQRLALARGIFSAKDSSLIMLDEPTSSVDSVNELAIHKNLHKHFADRCIVSSVHRLHLLPLYDMIYVLADGRVVEQGTFEELLAKSNSRLALLWRDYLATTGKDKDE